MGRGRPRKPVVLSPLYLDLRFLAQSGGDLVPYHHTEGHQAGLLQIREKTHRKNPNLHGQLQPDLKAFRPDCHHSIDPAQNRTIM